MKKAVRALLFVIGLVGFTSSFNNCSHFDAEYSFQSGSGLYFEAGEKRNLVLIDEDMLVEIEPEANAGFEKAGYDYAANSKKAKPWANGLIPLKFESTFTAAEKQLVIAACQTWAKYANISCPTYNSSVHGDTYLNVTKSGVGCYAQYGQTTSGKTGYINLAGTMAVSPTLPKGTCLTLGIAVHEFGHVLGMIHEQQRPDRDKYVKINTANLTSTCTAFNKYSTVINKGTSYDYYSIMHYAKNHCAVNPDKNTIDPIPANLLGSYELGDAVLKTEKLTLDDIGFATTVYGLRSQAAINYYSKNNIISRLYWSASGPIKNMKCVALTESADPDGWDNNNICSTNDWGLAWSKSGPITGKYCVRIFETGDTHSWGNNYLCSTKDYGLAYSDKGSISGMNCMKISEPKDTGWDNNFLCAP